MKNTDNGIKLDGNYYCPKCQSKMILKNGKRGVFLGCSSFPKCNFSMSVLEIATETGMLTSCFTPYIFDINYEIFAKAQEEHRKSLRKKPRKCPFCGSKSEVREIESDPEDGPGMGSSWFQVFCTECGARGPVSGYGISDSQYDEAVKKWNSIELNDSNS